MAENSDTSRVTDLYNAFMDEKYSEVRQLCLAHPEDVLQKISICNDTALHMAAHSKQKDLMLDLVKLLPADCNNTLSDIKNNDGNTILHEVAASDAMKDVAEELLNRDANFLTKANELGEKPIFCAARHGQIEMFRLLAGKMELKKLSAEDGKAHLQRNDGTTALHISIATECFDLAHYIAKRYRYLINERDINSMTAFQCLACNPSAFMMYNVKNGELMEDIKNSKQKIKSKRNCEWLVDLFINGENDSDEECDWKQVIAGIITAIKVIDGVVEGLINFDCSFFVAYKKFDERCTVQELVKLLVKEDVLLDGSSQRVCLSESNKEFKVEECSSKLSQTIKGQNSQESLSNKYKKSDESPLFLATMSNIEGIVRVILNDRPKALNHINKEGMNILHVAILYRHIDIFDMVVKHKVFAKRLLSSTDKEGNSVLHMVSQKRKSQASEKKQNPAVQLRDELLLFEKVKSASKMLVSNHLNNDNKTAEELFAATNEQLHQDAKEWLMRTTENCIILSVFIATVAFAAAYTVPGGPDEKTGIPLLRSRPFFAVFIVADVISITLALTSVGIFFSILTSSFPLEDFKTHLFKKLKQGVICLVLSVAMMAVAFGATIVLIMTENVVWDVVAFLPVPIFFLSCSPLRSIILGPCKQVFKFIVVSLVSSIFIGLVVLVTFVVYLLFIPFFIIAVVFVGLLWTVKKAYNCIIICKPVRSICGNKSQFDVQPSQPTASPTILAV